MGTQRDAIRDVTSRSDRATSIGVPPGSRQHSLNVGRRSAYTLPGPGSVPALRIEPARIGPADRMLPSIYGP